MESIVDARIERYLQEVRMPRPDVTRAMEHFAAQHDFPIIGPDVGRLLQLLVRASAAQRVLELGSGFGYSAYWFASALPADGQVVCTDFSTEHRSQAMDYLARAGLADKIDYRVGDALAIMDSLTGPFDIIFCDIDKESYPEVIERALHLLHVGGLFVVDNVLWSGKVAEPTELDAATQAVRAFNERLAGHTGFSTVIVPLRDGVSLSVKLSA
jgi:caffeoyl-CoA O-methyltransferase